MKKLLFIFLFSVVAATPALALREWNMMGVLGHTVVIYLPQSYYHHAWYNADNTSVHFKGGWSDAGGVTLTAWEDKWKADPVGDFPRVIPIDKNGKEGAAMQLRNHYPGDHWRELIPPPSPMQGMREQYAVIPDHQ